MARGDALALLAFGLVMAVVVSWGSYAAGYRNGLREAPEAVAAQQARWAAEEDQALACRTEWLATAEGARADLCESMIDMVSDYLWEREARAPN